MNIEALAPLRSRNYRLLFTSIAASAVGDWLDVVAVLVLVTTVWHRGAFGLALVAIVLAAPRLAAPFVGVLVDRSSPRRVMVGSDVARAVVTAGMVFAPNIWALAGLLAARSVFSVAFTPARQATLKRAVPAERLVSANALVQTMSQAVKLVGPALGGVLLAFLQPAAVIGINAVTFAVSALTLSGLRMSAARPPAVRSTYLEELREGLRFVVGTAVLRLVIGALGATVFLVFLYDAMMALAIPQLGLQPSYIGYLVSAVGLGGVAGSVALAQWGKAIRPFVMVGAGQLGAGAMVAVMGAGVLAPTPPPGVTWLAVAFLIGVAAAGVLIGFPTIVQTVTPDRLVGRTWTAVDAVPTVLQVIAPVIGAAALSVMSVGWLFLFSGTGLVLLSGVTLARQRSVELAVPVDRDTTTDCGGEVKTMSENTRVEDLGIDLGSIPEDQRAVLAGLSAEEVAVLASVKQRFDNSGGDVEGHLAGDSGSVFW